MCRIHFCQLRSPAENSWHCSNPKTFENFWGDPPLEKLGVTPRRDLFRYPNQSGEPHATYRQNTHCEEIIRLPAAPPPHRTFLPENVLLQQMESSPLLPSLSYLCLLLRRGHSRTRVGPYGAASYMSSPLSLPRLYSCGVYRNWQRSGVIYRCALPARPPRA